MAALCTLYRLVYFAQDKYLASIFTIIGGIPPTASVSLISYEFCMCFVSHSRTFSSLHFLQFPVFLVLFRTSPPEILFSMPAPAYFLSHSSTLSSHVLSFPPAFPYPIYTSHNCPALPLPTTRKLTYILIPSVNELELLSLKLHSHRHHILFN